MTLSLITAPALEPLTAAEAKLHLKVDTADDDNLITALIEAAREHLDGREGWLGRALISQTWELTLDAFPTADAPIALRLPPVSSIASITYVDEDGAIQTLATTEYELGAEKHWRPQAQLKYEKSWPGTRDQRDAVTVRFVAGYGAAAADVPQPIRQAMLLLIGHWYANREAVNVGNIVNELPFAVEALLRPYRAWGF